MKRKLMNVWEHPSKPEVRVYLNGMPHQPYGVKFWVEKSVGAVEGCDWTVRLYADWTVDRNHIQDATADYIEKLVGHMCTFDQIVEYARKS
jgi:hypothetical protein